MVKMVLSSITLNKTEAHHVSSYNTRRIASLGTPAQQPQQRQRPAERSQRPMCSKSCCITTATSRPPLWPSQSKMSCYPIQSLVKANVVLFFPRRPGGGKTVWYARNPVQNLLLLLRRRRPVFLLRPFVFDNLPAPAVVVGW